MAAKQFLSSITLANGAVVGGVFASVTSEDIAGGLGVAIGTPVGGANDDGSILFVDAAGGLAEAAAGALLYKVDPAFDYGPGTAAASVLQLGADDGAGGAGGAVEMWDVADEAYYSFFFYGAALTLGTLAAPVGAKVYGRTTLVGQLVAQDKATFNPGTDVVPVTVVAEAVQTADLTQWTTSLGAVYSRVNKAGYFMTRKTSAPADADLANSELAIWLDATPGATLAKFKAKDSGGTVRTGSVTLS